MGSNFQWYDYLLFGLTLVIAMGVGIYMAVRDRKRSSVQYYLLGGGKLTCIPTGLSIALSTVSAIIVLGTTAEVYTYGIQMCVYQTAGLLGMMSAVWLFVPLFYNLGITTLYEVSIHHSQFLLC